MGLFSSLANEMTLQSVEQLRNRDFVNISPLGHFPWPLERQKTNVSSINTEMNIQLLCHVGYSGIQI